MTSTKSKSIDQLAFNVSLLAYDHGLNSEDAPLPQRLGFREIKRNTKLKDLMANEYTVPSVQPTAQELSIDHTPFVGIWVGMRPSTAGSTAKSTDHKTTKGKSIETLGSKGGITILDKDPKALRVVVPMHKETASYYALVDPDASGLCSGLNVVITEVFFFPEFRNDDLTSTWRRKSEWSELVRKSSNPIEKITFSNYYDKTKFQVAPKRTLVNELSRFVGAYIEGGDRSALEAAIALIDRVDTDGAFTPPPKNDALAKLTLSRIKLTDDECKAALTQLLALAPELKTDLDISCEDLQRINAGLVNSQTVIPYTHLRAFIVQFVHDSAKSAASPDEQDDLGEAAVRCANLRELDGLSLIIEGQQKKMQDLQDYIHESITALKDSQGDSAIATAPTLPQVWTKYGLSRDNDSAKLYAMGVHRHNVQALSKIMEPLKEMLSENCEHLEKPKLSLPGAEAPELQDEQEDEANDENDENE